MEVYKSYLKEKYLERKTPHYGKWPDLPTEKYINMSVIEKGKPNVDDSKALTYGNIDAVKRKSDIAFKDLAKPTEDGVLPKFVLVEGAPGVGKTTFAWEACRKWAEGEILEGFDLVILVRLRDASTRRAKCLGDLIQYPCDAKIQSEIVREVSKSGVMLLFEGYDELPASLRQEGSLFRNIIHGREFIKGTVMVTSRHWASQPFLFPHGNRAVSQHIEILGFTTKNIEDYISSMLRDEPALLQDMKEYLELCPHIHSMMYIPLNCAIVLEVYKISKKHNTLIPKTATELYSSLIRSLLLRHICDLPEYQDKAVRIEDLKHLPACIKGHFNTLAELAYDAIFEKNQQIIFPGDKLPSDFNSLGLMQSSMELYVDVGATKSHNFLHLTIQEFLAAHHISTFPIQQQVEFYNRAHTSEMAITFLAGLSSTSFERFLTASHKKPHPHLNICWSFEARLQPKSAIALTETLRDPFTSYMLGYLMSKSTFCWNLRIESKKDVIHFFFRGILSSENTVSEATIALKGEMDQQQPTLAGLSRAAVIVDTLVVSKMSDFSDIGSFFSNLAGGDLLTIKHLHLQSIPLDDTHMKGFKLYLENTSVLQKLILEKCSFKSADGEALLSQGLQACDCLEKFSISFSSLQSGTMLNNGNKSIKILEVDVCSYQQLRELFTALYCNDTIEELVLKGTLYTGKDLLKFEHEVIYKALKKSTALKSLTLKIHWSPANISAICNALSKNNTLQKLTILTYDWVRYGMSTMLRWNRSLRELTILECWQISDGEIAKGLCMNHSLEKLCLRTISFKSEGIEALASAIKQNTTLKELEIFARDYQQIMTLSNALRHNNTLTKLIVAKPSLCDFATSECARDRRLIIENERYYYCDT
jgi:hypothetical protein